MSDAPPSVPLDPEKQPQIPSNPGPVHRETEIPTPGARWKGAYQIDELLTKGYTTPSWRGVHIISMDPVLVRAARSNDPIREKTWSRLLQLGREDTQKPREVHIVGKHRFEVCDLGPRMSLREWRSSQPCVDIELIIAFVRTLAELIGVLHERGIGHFNLRPDTIFVEEAEGKLRVVVVGGWEAATLFAQSDPIALPVDPFYAPPEAVGQAHHAPGDMLAAWDWWSLGRIVQELELGRHVLGLVLNKDVSLATPENKAQAEALLLQRAPGGHKPGAVEVMPELDKRLELLLKGLLTSNPEARWHRAEIVRWLDGASPREHYNLTRKDRCLRFLDEAFTIPELIEMLRSEEHWDQAPGQLLDGDMPGTLAAFVHANLASTLGVKLDSALALLNEEGLQEFPPEALREAVLAVALTAIAGGKMLLRGKRVDSESLKAYLAREDGSGQWLASVWALSSPQVIQLLEKSDRDAARVLGDLGKLANKALATAWEHEWLSRNDLLGIAQVWALSCEPGPILQKTCEALHREYACSTRPEVDSVFQPLRPSSEGLVLLAYMDSDRSRFGFLTHEEQARREYEAFKTQGQQMYRVIFWKRLYEALHTCPLLFDRVRWLFIGWSGLAVLIAIAMPGPLMTVLGFVPLTIALLTRITVSRYLRSTIAAGIEGAKPWLMFDGPTRCLSEIAGHPSAHRSASELMGQLQDINREISVLTVLKPTPPLVPAPSRFASLRLLSLTSCVMMVVLLVGCFWQMKRQPPSLSRIKHAWSSSASSTYTEEESAEPVKEVKIAWTFRAPSELKTVTPHEIVSATDAQLREARSTGKALMSGYEPSTISAPILVQVTTAEHFGFMLYDGRRDQVSGSKVYLLLYNPIPRNWIQIDGKRAYLMGN